MDFYKHSTSNKELAVQLLFLQLIDLVWFVFTSRGFSTKRK